jgi:hypothetical protein
MAETFGPSPGHSVISVAEQEQTTVRLRVGQVLMVSFFTLRPLAAAAQVVRDSGTLMASAFGTGASVTLQAAMRAQSEFERFRFANLLAPEKHGSCEELPRNTCFWSDPEPPPPPVEPAAIRDRRERLLMLLDSVAVNASGDRWAVEQRVRYLEEAGRPDSALAAARACRVSGWACDALVGFALHEVGRYVAADSAYGRALAKMSAKDRCAWRDIGLLIDDDLGGQYAQLACGDSRRDALEDRAWYYARTLYSLDGNDSRTEHYARKTMVMMVRDAPDMLTDSVLRPNAASNERVFDNILLWGWARGWTISRGDTVVAGLLGRHGGPPWTLFPSLSRPAYRYMPPGAILDDPAMSDSSAWFLRPASQLNGSRGFRMTRNGEEVMKIGAVPPPLPMARYAPPYARSLTPLEHQKAMFKRGDSALVVMAYDARVTKELAGGKLTAALEVIPNEKPIDYGKVVHGAPETGTLMVKAPWGPLLMSAEVYAPEKSAVARARYGISPPVAVGARVTLSDLLFFKPFGTLPSSVEAVAPHALPTERLMANEKLGVYWESYGTDPAGEKIKVSLTVVKEVTEAGLLQRITKSLRVVREATPVVVSMEDVSAMGKTVTSRALEVDISTLQKGSYIVQLEIEVVGEYVVRAEHRIEVVGP